MNYNQLSHQDFIERISEIQPDLIILEEYQKQSKSILVKDKYGVCKVKPGNLLQGVKPTIQTALNKTEYWINKYNNLFPKNELDLSLVVYVSSSTPIKIKNRFGIMQILPNTLMNGKIPNIRSAINKTEYWINMAKEVHNDFYDYSKFKYNCSRCYETIICPIHGDFKQESSTHLKGNGCKECGKDQSKKWNKENSLGGWSYKGWEKSASSSKYFDSFKVYIIRCWNKDEEFFKIGRTYKTIIGRLSKGNTKVLPYNYEVVKVIEDTALNICKLEEKLKRLNKNVVYLPNKKFIGMHECFKQVSYE